MRGDQAGDGAENFFASDGHIVTDVSEHRGFHVKTFGELSRGLGTPGHQTRALGHALFDIAAHDFALACGRQRAHKAVRPGANRNFLGHALGNFHRLFIAVRGYEHAGECGAGLAAVDEHILTAPAHCGFQVGVRCDDERRLAAQFLAHALHRGRCGLSHFHAGAGGAGKGDHVDVRVCRQGRTDNGTGAGHQVEHPGGQAGGVDDLGHHVILQRRHFRGLLDHGAARGQSRCDFAHELVQRVVPGGDETTHTHGLAHHERVAGFFGLLHDAGAVGVIAHGVNRSVHVQPLGDMCRTTQRLGYRLNQVLFARFHAVGDRIEEPGAFRGAGGAPAFECLSSGGNRNVYVFLGALHHLAD